MTPESALELALLPGTRELLAAHARELPQRDDLCGAFCGALALNAAGIVEHAGAPLDQDEVALAAGSVVAAAREPGTLPHGEGGRRDYRVELAHVEDPDVSGTTAAGLLEAIARLSAGALATIPYAGPWSAGTLAGLFDAACELERPVSLIANLATHHLWGAGASASQLLDALLGGDAAGPAPDWRVGHFACIVGRVRGAGASVYALADTYPALGHGGVHLQPQDRLAAALERRDMPAGGVVVVAFAEDAARMRGRASALGLVERLWDNGTASAGGGP